MIGASITLAYFSANTGGQNELGVGGLPILHDGTLGLELVAEGLEFPTSMAFLDGENILVLQQNDGEVRLVSEGRLEEKAIFQVDVANVAEQGLLGIAIRKGDIRDGNSTEVFLYFTEQVGKEEEGSDSVTRNRIFRYNFETQTKTLVNETLVLDLPGEPGPFHNGGKIAIGPRDGNLYAVIGDVNAGGGMLDNQMDGREPDDKSVILRVDRKTGQPVEDNPFYEYRGTEMDKLAQYYAYGIRNGFGMDFDPISNLLWMTENGPDSYDEINVVKPGFNSGWHKVMGPIARTNVTVNDDLVMFKGAAYHDPVFSWYDPIGVTDIEFYNSNRLGGKYENNLFVGDINNGNLYFFELNSTRTGLAFDSNEPGLSDLVADPVNQADGANANNELSSIIIGEGFGRITDIETGPDGSLYILTYLDGKIFRVVRN